MATVSIRADGALVVGRAIPPFESRIEDEPAPFWPNGELAGHRRPKALLLDSPSGLLTPVYPAVEAPALLTPFSQDGLFAGSICTRPPRVDA